MNKIEHSGIVSNGILKVANRKRLQQDLRDFKDCPVLIIIKEKGKRSLPQNAYYFGVVVEEIRLRLKELGHTLDQEDVHEFLKQKFNAVKIVTPQAEMIEIGQTTTDMNKGEFSEYIERIKQWAADTLEIYIPEPNEQGAFDI